MDTIFLGNDDQKNLVGSKLTKFWSLCTYPELTHSIAAVIWEVTRKRCPMLGNNI